MQKYCWVRKNQYSSIRENNWNDIFRSRNFYLERENQASTKYYDFLAKSPLETDIPSHFPIFISLLCVVVVQGLTRHLFPPPSHARVKKENHICTSGQWLQVLISISIKFLYLEAKNYICKEQTHSIYEEGERILRT